MATRPTLKKGMSGKKGTAIGDAIFLWRQYLGLPPAAGVTVFDFGQQTHDRTVAWQKKQKLSPFDGIVGKNTWARYDSLQYGPPPPAAVKVAEKIKEISPAPAPVPAAVKAAEQIKAASTPAPVPRAAVAAAQRISPSTVPVVAVAMPKNIAEVKVQVQQVATKAKEQVKQATAQVVKAGDAAPLWAKITGGAVAVALGIKALRKFVRA